MKKYHASLGLFMLILVTASCYSPEGGASNGQKFLPAPPADNVAMPVVVIKGKRLTLEQKEQLLADERSSLAQ